MDAVHFLNLHEAKDGGICSFTIYIYTYGIQFPKVTLVTIQMKHVLYRRIRPLFFCGGERIEKKHVSYAKQSLLQVILGCGFWGAVSHLTGYLEQLGC